MELTQRLVQRLSQQQLQNIELLQYSSAELAEFIENLAQENPLVEPTQSGAESQREPTAEDRELLRQMRWLEDNDMQNRYYQSMDEEEMDPLARASSGGGLEETLFRFLSRQLDGLDLDRETAGLVRYLAECLDENGYLRIPLADLAENAGVPAERLARARTILQSLEPAGVGAADLAECLSLQLERIGMTGPVLDVVRTSLEDLGQRHYRAIARRLSLSQEQVERAAAVIRELDPRPGAVFAPAAPVQYVQPDVFVEQTEDGTLSVRTRGGQRPPFRMNRYYCTLLEQTDDPEVRAYLTAKLRQAQGVLKGMEQRESTLLRCARCIVARQSRFFSDGPQALVSLRMADVARELDLHESTVSRAVREKYLQFRRGVFPLSYFFSRSAGGEDGCALGGAAAQTLLRQLIDREDKTAPLSDQKLCEALAEQGCTISRRTVAKYREQLGIPGAAGRIKRG